MHLRLQNLRSVPSIARPHSGHVGGITSSLSRSAPDAFRANRFDGSMAQAKHGHGTVSTMPDRATQCHPAEPDRGFRRGKVRPDFAIFVYGQALFQQPSKSLS